MACLIIGIQAGNQTSPTSRLSATKTPNAWISPSQQRTLVFVAVDDLQRTSPRLIAVWLILYRPDLSKVSLLPLYPSGAPAPGGSNPDLANTFSLNSDHSFGIAFQTALGAYQVRWNGVLLTDETGISTTVDWMRGVELQNQQITGENALASLVMPWSDLQAALLSQESLTNGICNRAGQLPAEANWIGLANSLTPSHFYTDLSLDLLFSDWKALVSGSQPLSCEIPTQP